MLNCNIFPAETRVPTQTSPHHQLNSSTKPHPTSSELIALSRDKPHATYTLTMTGEQSLSSSGQQQQKLPSYVNISCVISGYGRGDKIRNTSSSPVTSPVRFECPPLPTARDKHPHLFAPEDEEEKKKSLVQKKIESLYGRSAGEQWSKSKPSKKHDNISSSKGASVLHHQVGTQISQQQPQQQQAFDGISSSANGTPKKDYREAVFKRLDLEFIKQIDSDILNGSDQIRSGHVLMSPAEAIVEQRIQQLRLKSPVSTPTTSEAKSDREVDGHEVVDHRREQVCDQSLKEGEERREETQNKSEPESMKKLAESGEQESETGVTDSRDGGWFLRKVDGTCDQIRKRIKQTESLMHQESAAISDEVEGKVRAVIGKAELLMTKKLNQFRELCLLNINQSSNEDGFETKIQDLEGFWEMVSIQVQEVDKNLDEIDLLHDNGWILPQDQELEPKNRSRSKNGAKGSPVKVSPTMSEESAAREAQRRDRLIQAKKKMQSERKASGSDETDIAIFVAESQRPPPPESAPASPPQQQPAASAEPQHHDPI